MKVQVLNGVERSRNGMPFVRIALSYKAKAIPVENMLFLRTDDDGNLQEKPPTPGDYTLDLEDCVYPDGRNYMRPSLRISADALQPVKG